MNKNLQADSWAYIYIEHTQAKIILQIRCVVKWEVHENAEFSVKVLYNLYDHTSDALTEY
jgi:hypothetical protein